MRKVTILKQFLLADIPCDIVELIDLIIGGLAQLLLHLLKHPLFFFQLLLVDILPFLVLHVPLDDAVPLMFLEYLMQVDIINRPEALNLLSQQFVLRREIQSIVDRIDEDSKLNQFFLDLLDLIYEGHHFCFFFCEDVELYEDYPEEQELVLLLTVFYALGIQFGYLQPSLVELLGLELLLIHFPLFLVFYFLELLRVLVFFEVQHVLIVEFVECFEHEFFSQLRRVCCQFLVSLQSK